MAAGFLAERGVGGAGGEQKGGRKELAPSRGAKKEPVLADVDPEMAEIEALLRKRGIS